MWNTESNFKYMHLAYQGDFIYYSLCALYHVAVTKDHLQISFELLTKGSETISSSLA